jgi:hypothetical protein
MSHRWVKALCRTTNVEGLKRQEPSFRLKIRVSKLNFSAFLPESESEHHNQSRDPI